MIQHLVDNGTISINKHGFVISKSCLTNLLETLDIITEALNRGFSIDLALLDFSKAFDLVVHVGLLLKTKSLGFDKDIVDWIKAFLSDKRQRVVMGDISSEWQFVTSGTQYHKAQYWDRFYSLSILMTCLIYWNISASYLLMIAN